MCMEDIRIGRKTRTTFRLVTIAVTATPLVASNPNRVSLIVGVPSTNQIVIGPDANVTTSQGISVYNTGAPFELNIQDHGDAVIKELWAIGGAGVTVGVIESFLDEK
jgi:hypothetical protein